MLAVTNSCQYRKWRKEGMSSKSAGNKDGHRVKATAKAETPNEETRSPEREELIRRRAYELFLERGQVSGQELDDWLQAERQIESQIS
jgi:hypothetical protein